MAIWEQPNILSGTGSQQQAAGSTKAELGLCMLHTGTVSTEWAMRFKLLQIPPFIYVFNRNQPYDTAREQCTRAVLQNKDIKWVFHLDTDVLIPIDAIPKMIEFANQLNLPVLSGLYWAKKPGTPMPAAWVKTGEDPVQNRYNFAPIDVKPHVDTGALLPVDVTGAGCLLIKRDIFEQLDKSNPNKPYFQWGVGRKNEETGKPLLQMSEDFYFCTRLVEELNIHPHLCTNVKCDHICSVYKRADDGEFELSTRM